ncbi:hypothetical protein OW495_09015 [Vibrio sp. 14N.309.X.WAT.E.F5]|uniref:Curli production assembly/transport component CsgG n=1 Tax=Vibrio lentus TaxID=136468 RepID=A0AA45A8Q3_9VIBR|nr:MULTISPECIES: hypothetical protein [Vibrio]MCC4794722.1 hypothetical protein [Vibrio lentus]MCC4853713.1 hypothetical protein [Vibrio lentus]MDN2666855.1 hypothetical protein [Vibrio sp. 14N.309.X.WAT.E.F5]PME98004.1 hypothetical protein BCV23_12470 [Vibrio lentus]PMF87151.1 hypothetical protein BCV10_07080 [Vibrio lentus]
MLKKTLVAGAVLTTLSGCASVSEVCTPDTRVEIEAADIQLPSSDDTKVVVLPVDLEFKNSASKKMQAAMRNALETQIDATGANLVDRKIANKVKGEIKLAEQSGRLSSKGVPIADYAVITEITRADLSTSFSERRTYENDEGETKVVPASCSYDFDVEAIAKVVALPSMEVMKRIKLEGDFYSSSETSNSRCPVSESGYGSMAAKAAAEAVDHSTDLSKMLAASAPVLEMRQCAAGTQVRVAMGKQQKIKPGADIVFSNAMKSLEGDTEIYPIGEGYVVNNEINAVTDKHSWIVIDEELSLKVKKGTMGKVDASSIQCDFTDLECHEKNLRNSI